MVSPTEPKSLMSTTVPFNAVRYQTPILRMEKIPHGEPSAFHRRLLSFQDLAEYVYEIQPLRDLLGSRQKLVDEAVFHLK